MQAAHLEMTGNLSSITPTSEAALAQAVQAVRGQAMAFARLPISDKIKLLREIVPRMVRVAPRWIEAACKAKGLDPRSALAGEEWLAGPSITVRNLRLLIESLEQIAQAGAGKPTLPKGFVQRPDGRLTAPVFPTAMIDQALFSGFSCQVLLREGLSEEQARALQAEFYSRKDPQGQVSVILGAGNVSSIPPLDTLYKMFAEGYTAILKMNPVNEYLGPFLAEAMAPLIERDYLRIVYGGGDVGKFLVNHEFIDDVHITGSDVTHDLIVWGPKGPERERRQRNNDPVLKKTISSELGNVSPIMIMPAAYSPGELSFQARNVITMVQNNGSFNCNAGKMLITSEGWPQRQAFLDLLRQGFSSLPLRKAYYPGAQQRYDTLTGERKTSVERFGKPNPGELPWTFMPGLDPGDATEPLFQVEPFCSILSETALPASDPAEFISKATTFCNDRLWGTLNAMMVVPNQLLEGSVGAAVDRAILDLRYGSVAINHWPALVYGFVSPPWGGHPSATLANIQSGLGWVHNTYLLGGIEKSVLRGPLTVSPKPAWFFDNRRTREIGQKLVDFEANPSWWKVPGIALTSLQG